MTGLTAAKTLVQERFAIWQPHARCKGVNPSVFFPDGGMMRQREVAGTFCAQCPVRMECLTYALVMEAPGAKPLLHRNGVWGGLADTDRKSLTALLMRTAGDAWCDDIDFQIPTVLRAFMERPRTTRNATRHFVQEEWTEDGVHER